jgi:uncharacterized protein YndB with AHSA1/START domain
MSLNTVRSLRLTRTILASVEEVFAAWTEPEQMMKWACPAPGGLKSVDADLRVGGSYRIVMDIDGEAHTAFGVYREIDRPSRLVYTWDWEQETHAMGETVVTVEFTPEGDGTRVSLTHEGFPTGEAHDGHAEGWTACLGHFGGLFR